MAMGRVQLISTRQYLRMRLKLYYIELLLVRIIAPDLHSRDSTNPILLFCYKCCWLYRYDFQTYQKIFTMILTLRVDPLDKGASYREGRLAESQEGFETKIGLRADLAGAPRSIAWDLCEWRVRFLWNRALVRFLVGIDYKMPELVSNDLVMGSGLCPWSPTVALHDDQRHSKPLNLVPRGTQVPYSAANLVEELGYHKWYQSSRFDMLLESVDPR
ncbi:hypothetical protein M9H77_06684 [Catharanthus roseus]|uniref:Uncharacterized protein n=1 Tax=Catharanthus roseus TaxID=4058 RepID=A0ACC0BT18_CATRO|nr:hypothetical protein M9H77_06684 [Catharanthus roseus]